jgi:hypothetical protein
MGQNTRRRITRVQTAAQTRVQTDTRVCAQNHRVFHKEKTMKRRTWQVWTETEGEDDTILFTGSHAAALKFYKTHGGSNAGLHIGYEI